MACDTSFWCSQKVFIMEVAFFSLCTINPDWPPDLRGVLPQMLTTPWTVCRVWWHWGHLERWSRSAAGGEGNGRGHRRNRLSQRGDLHGRRPAIHIWSAAGLWPLKSFLILPRRTYHREQLWLKIGLMCFYQLRSGMFMQNCRWKKGTYGF